MRNVLYQLGGIDGIFFRECDFGVLGAFKQFTDQRVLGDTLTGGPCLGVKVPVHQKLTEAQERQGDVPPASSSASPSMPRMTELKKRARRLRKARVFWMLRVRCFSLCGVCAGTTDPAITV